jgi:hypothetical protein
VLPIKVSDPYFSWSGFRHRGRGARGSSIERGDVVEDAVPPVGRYRLSEFLGLTVEEMKRIGDAVYKTMGCGP